MSLITIRQAESDDLDALVSLFDSYRGFYQQTSESDAVRAFLTERLTNADSVLFLGLVEGVPAGLTQLYPSFSSVRMRRIWILNDLFVSPEFRNQGLGKSLLERAETFARETGAVRLELSTETDNRIAQALYEKQGWIRNTRFFEYTKSI